MKRTALVLITAMILAGLCGCGDIADSVTESLSDAENYFGGGDIADSVTESLSDAENYFGGKGKLKAIGGGNVFYDNDSVYSSFGNTVLMKYNRNTETILVACDDPGCDHSFSSTWCKARKSYCVFNGELIKTQNESIWKSDGTAFQQGYLYLCGENQKQVFKNEKPEGHPNEECDNWIGYVFALEDDYLVLFNSGYFYILDRDFNIAYTVIGVGSYMGGVYYMGGEIYYIDNLYHFRKLDPESGESVPVDLGGMKIWEGQFDGDLLWFSNGDELCAYDYKTGEVKVHAQYAFFLNHAGKYIRFSDKAYGRDGHYLFDKESGEVRELPEDSERLFFFDGSYYTYSYDHDSESGTLTQYEEDMTTVIKTIVYE